MTTVNDVMALADNYEHHGITSELGKQDRAALLAAVESMAQELEAAKAEIARLIVSYNMGTQNYRSLEAERDALQAKLDEQTAHVNRLTPNNEYLAREADRKSRMVIELQAKLNALEPDAARYRWLRENVNTWGRIEMQHNGNYPERMDAAIYAAMAAHKEQT